MFLPVAFHSSSNSHSATAATPAVSPFPSPRPLDPASQRVDGCVSSLSSVITTTTRYHPTTSSAPHPEPIAFSPPSVIYKPNHAPHQPLPRTLPQCPNHPNFPQRLSGPALRLPAGPTPWRSFRTLLLIYAIDVPTSLDIHVPFGLQPLFPNCPPCSTTHSHQQHIDNLKKENFSIKLRVHFLEDQLARLAPDQMEGALVCSCRFPAFHIRMPMALVPSEQALFALLSHIQVSVDHR